MLNASRFAQSGSQTDRNTRTNTQEMATLSAAVLSLITTSSPAANGRTATNDGTARILDQKSGLENPLPRGRANIMGIAHVQPRSHTLALASFRKHQERGPMT